MCSSGSLRTSSPTIDLARRIAARYGAAMPSAKPLRPGAFYAVLGVETLAALDAWAAALNEHNDGPAWNRTAVLRALIARGLRERAAKGEAP